MTDSRTYEELIRNLSTLGAERMISYPVRDESRVKFMAAVEGLASCLRETIKFEDFKPRADILLAADEFSDNPVFICGAMKSGTTLIGQLLDGHPDLLVIPGDAHYVNCLKKWGRDSFAEISSHWLRQMVSPTGKEPFFFLGPERDTLEQFMQYLRYNLYNSKNEIFVCGVMAAYAAVSSKSGVVKKKYWVEKTPQNELHTKLLDSHFPKAKFIHILRDPLENIASLKQLSNIRKWNTTPEQYAVSMRRLFRAGKKNCRKYGNDRYHIVRYEDLVSCPEKEMRTISEFLGIPFDDVLLKPTENSRPAVSNSMFSERRVTGEILRSNRSERCVNQLSVEEVEDIVTILYQDAAGFGYEWDLPDTACNRKGRLRLRVKNLCGRLGRGIASVMNRP